MSSIVIQGDTSGSITVEAPSVAGTHTLTLPKATGNIATDATVGLGMKNLIINGGMEIHQRGGTITMSTGNYNLDRFFSYTTTDGVQTAEQSTDAPNGFKHSLKVTTTTADSSLAAGQRTSILQRVEGYNIIPLAWGTADAKTVTLSFWVKSSITGTHGGSVGNGNDSRAYPFTYTILSANTWEKKTITIPGDTTGTWATTNGRSLQIAWGLGVGSTYSGTAFAWESADRNSATGATTDVIGTLGATWFITGVQLEIGENATPFENRMYGTELALCQRYYQVISVTLSAFNTNGLVGFTFLTEMRAAPTVTRAYVGTTNRMYNVATGGTVDVTSPTIIANTQAIRYWYSFSPSGWASSTGSGWETTYSMSSEL